MLHYIKKISVKRDALLLLACLVWGVAGFNVLHIGLAAYPTHITLLNIFFSLVVCLLFKHFIFDKLVIKHSKRIGEFKEERQFFLNFFDKKSFIIMACMITFGMLLRACSHVPEGFIASFYTGLGIALLIAGLSFGYIYLRKKKTPR